MFPIWCVAWALFWTGFVGAGSAVIAINKTVPHRVCEMRTGGSPDIGTVKWFNAARGYGFVAPDDGSKALFVHYTYLPTGVATLDECDRIAFRRGDKGSAQEISLLTAELR